MKTMFLTESHFLRSKQTKRNLKTKKKIKTASGPNTGFYIESVNWIRINERKRKVAARLFRAPESYFEKLHNLLFCTYDSLAIHRADSILAAIRFMQNLYTFIFRGLNIEFFCKKNKSAGRFAICEDFWRLN